MTVLGCDWKALHATRDTLASELAVYDPEHVWAPLPELGGNSEHNTVGELASILWPDRITFFTTYTDRGRTRTGDPLVTRPGWQAKKRLALACYASQQRQPATRPHFDRGLDEYVMTEVAVHG